MEKDSKTTVAVERTTFAKLDRLAKANSVSKMEYITHAINYFEKYGINPVEHESPAQEMQKLIKRMDQVFAFLKKQETDLVRPACEALAGASTQITISLSSLLSEEKFRRFLKDNKELLAEIINSSGNNGKAIGRTEKAVRDADSTIRKNQDIIFKRIEASETAQIKAYKHIVSIARNAGQLAINPFAGYLISPEQKDRGFLTKEELQLLINAKMKNAQYELVRDLFVFSSFCGLSYSDVKNLTKSNLQTSFDGHLWIITRRQKTNTDSSIRLLEVPKRIIEKYKGYSRDNRIFPVPSNSSCNAILKKIAKQCGINKRLTYHVSRHTFSTTVTLSQGVPIETVSRMLGHTNIKTTQIYAKITKEKISQDMEILSHKLESLEKQITERI